MNYRYTNILATKTLGETGTEPVTIKIKDVITAIRVMVIATSAGTDWSDHPAANVTKVEIVDGSDVLYSLTGKCAEAMDFYQRPTSRKSMIEYRDGRGCACVFDINFGRYLGDREIAFDPKKFINPQIRVTWDIDVCQTDASAGTLEIDALVFDEAVPAPVGFFMTKEIKAYTPVATTWEYTDLPLDHPMRTLGVQCQVGGADVATSLDLIKLSEDNDKRVPIDGVAYKIGRFYNVEMGEYSEYVRIMLTNALVAYYVTPGNGCRLASSSLVASTGVQAQTAQGGKVNIQSENAGQAQFQVTGNMPHQVLAIPFGRRNVIDDWYDVTKLGSLKLSLKAGGAAAGTFRIITEQLRRY